MQFRLNPPVLCALLLLMTVLFGCKAYRHSEFSKSDVESAQNLIGLHFSDRAIDTMYRYLDRNHDGYDSMRQHTLDYRTAPALYFDPRPEGFAMPRAATAPSWPEVEAPQLPGEREALAFYPVYQLAALIRSGQITSLELTRMYLERIKKHDPQLRAVITLTEDLALEQARRADREIAAGDYRGPLHGIPYGVKDLMAVKGHPTTWGSAPYRNQVLNYTATVVKRLEAAGAVLIAKLTSGALARGDVWFDGKTRNPWDTLQGASGSSAGSASATAAGLVAFSLGTETLGSITSPSTRCGLTGLRPTYGRVSRAGVMALSWSMDKVGPICRSALDCALVLDAIRGADPRDRTAVDAPFPFQPGRELRNVKVGYLEELFEKDSTDNGIHNERSLETFRRMGLELEPVSLPDTFPFEVFDIILRAEAGAFFDELVRGGRVDEMVQQNYRSRANSLRQSRFIPAVEYLQANRHRQELIEAMHQMMQRFEIVIAPSRGGHQLQITNLTGHPAIALPNGFDDTGHPTSITLLGNLYDETPILELAHRFQQQTEFEERRPPLFAAEE